MLLLSFLIIILAAIQPKSNAASNNAKLEKLCQGQRFGTAVPNPHDCYTFYVCQFTIQLTDCPTGLQFDRRKKVCNWPKDAGCDWVEPDESDTNDDKYPEPEGPEVKPNQPIPDEEPTLPETDKPNQGGTEISSEEDNNNPPSSGENIPEHGETSKESEESKPVTSDDTATKDPPTVDPNNSSEEDNDYKPHGPSTIDDMITDEPRTPEPSSEENQDKQPDCPSTDDDMITYTQTPVVNSEESVDPTPALPKPGHPQQPPSPPNSEKTDQQPSEGNQNSNEIDNPEGPNPPNTDDNMTKPGGDIPTTGNHSSHHWNLIASIVSVESSHTGGFINHPTVGAHSPETGYPVDVMTGYDPKKVQCLHSGLYFLPHPTSCQKYFICAYRHLHLHSCGNGVIWNHKREQCDVGSNSRCYARDAESEDNTTELVTPFIDDQTRKTTRRVVKPSTRKPMSKTTRLPATATATATTISHKLPTCPPNRQIYLPNLDDCHRYYICIMGKPVLTSCPNGMHWDVVEEVCDKPSVARCARRQK